MPGQLCRCPQSAFEIRRCCCSGERGDVAVILQAAQNLSIGALPRALAPSPAAHSR
jgi:hypothetical protein